MSLCGGQQIFYNECLGQYVSPPPSCYPPRGLQIIVAPGLSNVTNTYFGSSSNDPFSWSSNTSDWASNASVWASNTSEWASNAVATTTSTPTPTTSNFSNLYASNLSVGTLAGTTSNFQVSGSAYGSNAFLNTIVQTPSLPVKHSMLVSFGEKTLTPFTSSGPTSYVSVFGGLPGNPSSVNFAGSANGESLMPFGFFQNSYSFVVPDPDHPESGEFVNGLTNNDYVTQMRVLFWGSLLLDWPQIVGSTTVFKLFSVDNTGSNMTGIPGQFCVKEQYASYGYQLIASQWIDMSCFASPSAPSLYLGISYNSYLGQAGFDSTVQDGASDAQYRVGPMYLEFR